MLNVTLDHTWIFGAVNVVLNLYAALLITVLIIRQRSVKHRLEVHDRKKSRWVRRSDEPEKLTMVGHVELEEKDNNDTNSSG